MYWSILLFFPIVVLHEIGHIITAKLLKLSIEKIGFEFRPFPRFYVAIIAHKMTLTQRIIFLLSGNIVTVSLFIVFIVLNVNCQVLYYLFAFQIIIETNPIYSDYVVAIISYLYRDEYRKYYTVTKYKGSDTEKMNPDRFKENYMFSLIWYSHFIAWGILIVILFSH